MGLGEGTGTRSSAEAHPRFRDSVPSGRVDDQAADRSFPHRNPFSSEDPHPVIDFAPGAEIVVESSWRRPLSELNRIPPTRDLPLDFGFTRHNMEVSQQVVDTMVEILAKGSAMRSVDELLAWGRELGIETSGLEDIADIPSAKKGLAIQYLSQNMGGHRSLDEHRQALIEAREAVINHFMRHNSGCVVSVFGSHGNGKVSSILSDLDFLIVVPKDARESDVLLSMYKAGIVFGSRSQFDDLSAVASSGASLCRLYGMSTTGVPVEFHVIGEQDFRDLPKVFSKGTQRVTPIDPKMELRVSYDGARRKLPKPGDVVPNFSRTEDGRVFRGFFINAALNAQILYDGPALNGRPDGATMFHRIWEKDLGATLVHQGKLMRLPNDRLAIVSDQKPTFSDTMLPTLFHDKEGDYAKPNLALMQERFEATFERLACRADVVHSYRASGDLLGARLDRATKELHRVRVFSGSRLIATDFDHTIWNPSDELGLARAAKLVADIARSGRSIAIITGRDASFLRDHYPAIKEELSKITELERGDVFIGVSNGLRIFRADVSRGNSLELIKEKPIGQETRRRIISAYLALAKDAVDPSVAREMAASAMSGWSHYISADLLAITRSTPGVWAEKSKLSILLPADASKYEEFLESLRSRLHEIDPTLVVLHSNNNRVADISFDGGSSFPDPKLSALNHIQTLTRIRRAEVSTFGDSPNGNDRGLLSLQNSFTNTDTGRAQPIFLEGPEGIHPVQKVHRAMRYLIANGNRPLAKGAPLA